MTWLILSNTTIVTISVVAVTQILSGIGRGVYVLMSGLDIERGAGAAGPLG